MRETFLNSPADVAWLRETHLSAPQVPPFGSATLEGNEDCPQRITLYASAEPNVTDAPVAIYALTDELSYIMVAP